VGRPPRRDRAGRQGRPDARAAKALKQALNQLGIIAAPPLLALLHDLTGGYAALWACVVALLALAYAVTRIAAE
jgi:predicted MFS family arabinose efflux permease